MDFGVNEFNFVFKYVFTYTELNLMSLTEVADPNSTELRSRVV